MWQPALPEVSEVQLFGSEAWRICRAVVWMPPPAPVSLSGIAPPPPPNMLLLDPGASCEPLRHSLNPNTVSSPKWCLHWWHHLQKVSRLAGASSWVSPVSQCQQQPHPNNWTQDRGPQLGGCENVGAAQHHQQRQWDGGERRWQMSSPQVESLKCSGRAL